MGDDSEQAEFLFPMGDIGTSLSEGNEMADSINLSASQNFGKLATLPPRVVNVYISAYEEYELPVMPPWVESLSIEGAELTGRVTLPPGLKTLELYGMTSEVPLDQWELPSSLEELTLSDIDVSSLDLRQSKLQRLFLDRVGIQVMGLLRFPESLLILDLSASLLVWLPILPRGLNSLSLHQCPNLVDYSSARGSGVTDLIIDRFIPFHRDFSQLTALSLSDLRTDETSEISLLHLRELTFDRCKVSAPIEVNAPQLEKLTFTLIYSLDLVGQFSETVTELNVGEGFSSLMMSNQWSALRVLTVSKYQRVNQVLELPRLPELEQLSFTNEDRTPQRGMLAMTKGELVDSYQQYVAAWTQYRVPKNARSAFRGSGN